MLNQAVLCILLAGCASKLEAAVDLVAVPHEYVASGLTFVELNFTDGDTKVVYEPPRGWSYRTEEHGLQLLTKVEHADVVVQSVSVETPQALDDKAVAALKEQVTLELPAGSQGAQLVEEEQNPVLMDGHASYSLTVSFVSAGETFLRSIVFVNLSDSQLRFRVTARKSDFPKLQQAFRSSLQSWHWSTPAVAEAKS